jgi:metallophosphoesterase (TIGR00282 family)
MKLLFLGDIVGRPGRKTVEKYLPQIIKEKNPDWVIANAENIAGGKGFTKSTLNEMMKLGIDAFTGGNHIFSNPEGFDLLEKRVFPLAVPANFSDAAPGDRSLIVESKSGKKLLLVSLLGQTFMKQTVSSPFEKVDEILDEYSETDYDVSLFDFHAEATSEKYALKAYLDGRASALVGTHTHIPTADADITSEGLAYQTDTGMNGSLDSCIGVKNKLILKKIMTQLSVSHELEKRGRMQFNAVLITFDKEGKAKKISPIRKVA